MPQRVRKIRFVQKLEGGGGGFVPSYSTLFIFEPRYGLKLFNVASGFLNTRTMLFNTVIRETLLYNNNNYSVIIKYSVMRILASSLMTLKLI